MPGRARHFYNPALDRTDPNIAPAHTRPPMRLIVEIPASGAHWRFVLLDDAQTPVRHGQCTIDLLPRAADVVAVVPITSCAWHRLQLPKGSDGRLQAVVQSQLEDHVLDDLADLHAAVLNSSDKSTTQRWVMVCHKAWLRDALTALHNRQLPPSIVTAWWLPAQNQAQAQGWLCGDAGSPALAQSNMLGVWTLDASFALDPALPVSAEPHWAAWAEEKLQRPVAVSTWYEQLARCGLPEHLSQGNLAQFDLSEFGDAGLLHRLLRGLVAFAFAPRWKAPRWGLVAFAAVNVLGLNAYALQQQQQLANKRLAAQQVLTQTFPEVKVVVDASAQMQKQLQLLRQRNASLAADDFEVLLGAWAGVGSVSKSPPETVVYRDRELRLRAPAAGAAEQTLAALNQGVVGKPLRWSVEGPEWVLRGAGSQVIGRLKP